MSVIQTTDIDFKARLAAFCASSASKAPVREAVTTILDDVRARGDAAVAEWTLKIDGADLTPATFRVPVEELRAAEAALSASDRAALLESIRCVEDFHRHSMPSGWMGTNPQGAQVGERYYPLERVGIWVPGGSVPLVSTVIMSTIPARVAGVQSVAVFTPPRKDGTVSPGILAALSLCGVTEVYRVGGVMAVGAMAYGTATIPAVCQVYGPGNDYVIEAKRQVFGTIGVDLLPGPSEVMVIADSRADAACTAADLLAQAEHGSGKEKIYLATTDATFHGRVCAEIERQVATLSHADKIRKVLSTGWLTVVCANLAEAAEIANYVAPEHLELHIDPTRFEEVCTRVHNAGAILLGRDTPTVLGDFTAGPSHTLPTNRAGRFSSGLRVMDFLRRTSVVRYDKESLGKARSVVAVFSRLEQLDAHGRSLEIRFQR